MGLHSYERDGWDVVTKGVRRYVLAGLRVSHKGFLLLTLEVTKDIITKVLLMGPSDLVSGGWPKTAETSFTIECIDTSLPVDAELAKLAPRFAACAEHASFDSEPEKTMKSRVEAAGLTNMHPNYP